MECTKAAIDFTETTHAIDISLFVQVPDSQSGQIVSPLLLRHWPRAHFNYGPPKLLSVFPDRGQSVGGAELIIKLDQNPTAIDGHSAQCRFSSADAGDTVNTKEFAYVSAEYVDEHHLRCTTPPFPSNFVPILNNASFTETYIVISEYNGVFRDVSELRFRFYLRPEIL